jgi:hypothetical protein
MAYGSARNPYAMEKTGLRRKSNLFLTFVLFITVYILYVFTNYALREKNNHPYSTEKIGDEDLKIKYSTIPVVAYAISLTSCAETPTFIDGAAVLAHSIHLSSSRNPTSGSRYDYKMYAIVHHDAKSCIPSLEKLGYSVLSVDVPVPVKDIEGDYLRENVHRNGCCGELEFIKLWAYTLIEHPFVVHLDLDTMILKPLDELFDAANNDNTENIDAVMWPEEHHTNTPIDAFFTRDYNMRPAGKKPVGVQGGFLVIKPSMNAFNEFKGIIRKGDFNKKGWGGLGFGPFYGSMTFQGIIPYYYDALHPGTAVELNRCIYNQMADNPRDQRTVNNIVHGNCRDGREECEDCRERGIEEIKTAHFTLCQKPWECLPHDADLLQHRLCRKLFSEWYRIRADLELSKKGLELSKEGNGKTVIVGTGKYQPEIFRGFCKSHGKKGYIPMKS